jgi:hypothetical protein
MYLTPQEELFAKIKSLNERLWENRANRPQIEDWLANFVGSGGASQQQEELAALYLLSKFMYFGDREVRELLRALYRDLFRYPIIEQIRRSNNDSKDVAFVTYLFHDALRRTRFLGMGNPAESGTHLLYSFRQENGLQLSQFLGAHQILEGGFDHIPRRFRDSQVDRYVFIDDFCGSGDQAALYSDELLSELRKVAADTGAPVRLSYYALFGTSSGIDSARKRTLFDDVACVLELDDSYRCFHAATRYFQEVPAIVSQGNCKSMVKWYGDILWPSNPLGWKGGELLLGFHHNIPDNTLPIIWYNEPSPAWQPIFPRFAKSP